MSSLLSMCGSPLVKQQSFGVEKIYLCEAYHEQQVDAQRHISDFEILRFDLHPSSGENIDHTVFSVSEELNTK